MHPKKVLPKNRFFRTWANLLIGKIVFWLKLCLGALFTKVICTFLKSVRKDGFFDAHSTYSKKKIFISLKGQWTFLRAEKGQKWKNRSKFRKTVFYKQILDFHYGTLPKLYVTHRIYEILSISLVPTVQPTGI